MTALVAIKQINRQALPVLALKNIVTDTMFVSRLFYEHGKRHGEIEKTSYIIRLTEIGRFFGDDRINTYAVKERARYLK